MNVKEIFRFYNNFICETKKKKKKWSKQIHRQNKHSKNTTITASIYMLKTVISMDIISVLCCYVMRSYTVVLVYLFILSIDKTLGHFHTMYLYGTRSLQVFKWVAGHGKIKRFGIIANYTTIHESSNKMKVICQLFSRVVRFQRKCTYVVWLSKLSQNVYQSS